jgi:hypothetical protein
VREIADKTKKILPAVRGVRSLEVCLPSDPRTGDDWDLCLLLRFASMPDVEAYRTDPVHRSYVDIFLKPMLDKINVYNFELRGP